jgi:hypothetical protein
MRRDDQTASEHLKGFVPRSAPPEMRQKVLAAAEGTQLIGRFLTSAQWGMAAVCALLIIGALGGDTLLSRTQARRLDALLNDRLAASPVRVDDRSALEEIVGVQEARSMRLLLTRPRQEKASATEGWTVRTVLTIEEKEDADVHSKNPR